MKLFTLYSVGVSLCLILLPIMSGCGDESGGEGHTAADTATGSGWTEHLVWDSGEKIQGVAFGDVDPDHDGVEAVAVTESGVVGVAGLEGTIPWGGPIHTHPHKLNTAFVADLDPDIPGDELYLAGGGDGTTGQVLQAVKRDGAWSVRSIWNGEGFVHALGVLPSKEPEGTPELVIPTYTGAVHLATPTAEGPWPSRLLYQELLESDSNRLLLKDLVVGDVGGTGNPRLIFVCSKAGRGVLIDPDNPTAAQVLHVEEGGIARLDLGDDGVIYGACNLGNVLKIARKGNGWNVDTLYRDVDQLRGVRCGTFRLHDRTAPIAIYGYSGFVRALYSNGIGWDSESLIRDSDRAHSLDMADVIADNDSDELLFGGYSGKLTIVSRQ